MLEVLRLRERHPTWGPKKLYIVLGRVLAGDQVPGVRTIARSLERAGEVVARRRPTPRSRPGEAPQTDIEPALTAKGRAVTVLRA